MHAELNQPIPKEFIHTEFIQDNPTKKKKIKEILSEASNKECFDCGQQNPEYISLNNGIFICRICVLIHRQFPEEVSSIRQNINSLTDKELLMLYKGGNLKLSNFVTYEFPGLQNYTPEILYKTKAMEYYRERLKYFSGMNEKPSKPNDLVAYKLIDEEPNNIQKFRRHNNNLRRFLNCVAQRNFNNGNSNFTKTNSRIDTELGISNSCSLNYNFNTSNNNVNFSNKNTYVKKRNIGKYKKPLAYKKNHVVHFKINNINDTFEAIKNENPSLANSYLSPRPFNSPRRTILNHNKILTQKRPIDYSNEDKEPDSCVNELEEGEDSKYRPNLNALHKMMSSSNIYHKPKLKILNSINNNYKFEGPKIPINYAVINSSSYDETSIPNHLNCELSFQKHKPCKSNLSYNENEYDKNNHISSFKIKKHILDYNNTLGTSNLVKNKRNNSKKPFQRLIYNRRTNTKYYFTLKDINDTSSINYNNNSLNDRSSLKSQKNITYNINYISINEEKTNDDPKKSTIPVLKVSPKSPIFVNRKKNKNSKLSLFHSNNSTSILHKQPNDFSRYSKAVFNRNGILKNKSQTMDYENLSLKASQDKKEQEDIENEALQKIKLEGNLDGKVIYNEITNPDWNKFSSLTSSYKMKLVNDDLSFNKTNKARNIDTPFQVAESGTCSSTLKNRYRKKIREKNLNMPITARESLNDNIRKKLMNLGKFNHKND